MIEELNIKNIEYFQQIVKEFRENCNDGSFDLIRDYTDVKNKIDVLLNLEFSEENFKLNLYEILKVLNRNFWGMNFLTLGFSEPKNNKEIFDELYTEEQWEKLYNFLNKNSNYDEYIAPENDFINGYNSTATVTPILHLINMEKFPVINSVYINLIKEFYNEKISNKLTEYKTEKDKVNAIAEDIKTNYLKDDLFKDIVPSELLDRLAFWYAQKQSSAVSLKHKNIIYYGPPGTGKTYSILETVNMLTEGNRELYKMIQFHPSYSYEDFIEGIKPSGMDDSGNIKFDLVDGEFKKFCIEAMNDRDNNYYFIIDEINRAELSRVFGEILFCLEYRLPNEINDETKGLIRTPYATLLDEKLKKVNEEEIKKHTVYWNNDEQKSYFGIPDNVFVIGTMNDVDRSIDSFDLALRRRFRWEYMNCKKEVLKNHFIKNKVSNEKNSNATNITCDDYITNCQNLNKYIAEDLNLGKSYKIGHSYFMNVTDYLGNKKIITQNSLKQVWDYHIAPLLFEYFRSAYDEKKAEDEMKKSKEKFIPKKKKENNDTNI